MKKNYLENIKILRTEKGISQSQMAEKLGFTQNNYSKIERGLGELTVDRLYEIAEILDVSVFQILIEKDIEILQEKIREEIESNVNVTRFEEFKESFKKDFEQKMEEEWKKYFDGLSQAFQNHKNRAPDTPERLAEKEVIKEGQKLKRYEIMK